MEAFKGKIQALPNSPSPDVEEKSEEIVFELPLFLKKLTPKYMEADKLIADVKSAIAVVSMRMSL